ncbi:MAG: PfkB family carbohydrate kinase [Planctomycetota bacterium]
MTSETLSKPLDVVVLGLNIVDVLVRLPREVQVGEKHQVNELVIQGGAPAGNAACGLARLGWRTGFATRLGDNALSANARADLERYGLQPDLFVDTPGAQPAAAVVQIDPADGERTVFYSLEGYLPLEPDEVPVQAIQNARLLLTDGYEPEVGLCGLEAACEAGVSSVLDIEAGDPAVMSRMIELGTDCILPLIAAQQLSGEDEPDAAMRHLAEWTDAQLVVTDGTHGSWALTPEGVIHQPPFLVDAVDTTGCGDSFHAGYASALLDGLSLVLRLEMAALVAARVATQLGGRTALPTREELAESDLSKASPILLNHLRNTCHA